ncbi:hypothetical protein OIDMADRAFT_88812, partial [Oidiodendron maius Zn]
ISTMKLVEKQLSTRPFRCDWEVCNKSFDRKSDLQRHYRIHTNERPYSCSTPGCCKSFIQAGALAVHIRTHTGEKPYKCQHIACGKRFSDSSSLTRHRNTHTRKRPYKRVDVEWSKSVSGKTAMAKHQPHSRQRSINSSELDNAKSSDSDGGEFPTALQQSLQALWPPNVVISTRPAMPLRHRLHFDDSFAILTQENDKPLPVPAYGYRHSRHGGAQTDNMPISEHIHYNPFTVLRPSRAVYSPFYAPGQHNAGVPIVGTTPTPIQTDHLFLQQPEIIQSCQDAYSPISRARTIVQGPYHAHWVAQAASYALLNPPPAEQAPVTQFQQSACHLAQEQ